MSVKMFINDSIKTLLSTTFLMIIIQFIVFPYFSSEYTSKLFGEILTIYSIFSISSVVIGNTLNNLRLLDSNIYKNKEFGIDYLKLLLLSISLTILITTTIFIINFKYNVSELIILNIIIVIMILKNYLQVYLRLELLFNKLLKMSIIQGLVLIILVYVLKVSMSWWVIILIGEFAGILYLLNQFVNNGYSFNKSHINFKNLNLKFWQLSSVNFVNNLIIYFDRFLIFSVLGGSVVTISFVATFVGKILSGIVSPINGVILTYISARTESNNVKLYKYAIFSSLIVALITLLLVLPISKYVVVQLYDIKYSAISRYLIIGNLSVITLIMGNILFPMNIKYTPIKYQTIVQTVYFILYFLLCIPFTLAWGLMGFFIAVTSTNIIRYFLMVYTGFKYMERKT
ncbi:polysaccharide biosynthesis protein [Staphylococcus kloosii]|jgi:O-antigen/teichoic acid export membrane protein|uniref:Polysaccharide biosynthesis protein n=1 Tax=Staphylococcus kloosii TaxID=29384 RepID=A0A151A349_9STAP|nr:hypothetical protein [Staphylococcus kloosii]KYH13848.1 hypothetical protein A0131_03380 [Staphylococcus kloosii]